MKILSLLLFLSLLTTLTLYLRWAERRKSRKK
ncbi:hypothetical protein L1278_003573 [Pontibacter sp. HSC-36F09]|nr:hypothetical protein [Pontibacter sp. HSC-36F09]